MLNPSGEDLRIREHPTLGMYVYISLHASYCVYVIIALHVLLVGGVAVRTDSAAHLAHTLTHVHTFSEHNTQHTTYI